MFDSLSLSQDLLNCDSQDDVLRTGHFDEAVRSRHHDVLLLSLEFTYLKECTASFIPSFLCLSSFSVPDLLCDCVKAYILTFMQPQRQNQSSEKDGSTSRESRKGPLEWPLFSSDDLKDHSMTESLLACLKRLPDIKTTHQTMFASLCEIPV